MSTLSHRQHVPPGEPVFEQCNPGGFWNGTCVGAPGDPLQYSSTCDGFDRRDFLRGRRARWVETRTGRLLCGTCKRKWEMSVAATP